MNCIDSVTVPFFLKGRVLPYATACAACVPNTALNVLRVVAVVSGVRFAYRISREVVSIFSYL